MANEINAVAGQLWGIPMGEVYTAGPGIKIDNVHKIVSVDETVLWESPDGVGHNSCTLSESKTNFERVRIYFGTQGSSAQYGSCYETLGTFDNFCFIRGKGASNVWLSWIRCVATNATTITVPLAKSFNFQAQSATTWQTPSVSVNQTEDIYSIWKVVGINRKSA